MKSVAIHTENLGKRYQLGATVDFSRTFREVLLGLPRHFYRLSKSKAQRLLDKTQYPKDTPKDTFWALRNINLDIKHGDVVGIIGRNGAGKSTLLKILSKITSPTTGFARINGRVGSLLEVGTGFHPELSGRENIYLNGSILGMRKNEIQKKFDEIVAFAEVEQFLDTPIKRYSSGMNVRLAFAVAAHLEPEILIVDEVLAVGDAAFQKKCLGKMEDVSKQGRTVLFVSHNMGAVRNLCPKSILLNSGEVEMLGDTNDVIDSYLERINDSIKSSSENPVFRNPQDIKDDAPQIIQVTLKDKDGNLKNSFASTEEIHVELKIKPDSNLKGDINVIWYLYDRFAQKLACGISYQMQLVLYSPQIDKINFVLYPEPLIQGDYLLGFQIINFRIKSLDIWEYATKFKISENDYNKTGFNYPEHLKGEIFVKSFWENGLTEL
ncbi:MAG: polysaccharide ABC transporter ATP-binding protein [bacterium]